MLPEDLRADCSRCLAICCVAPAFTASSDFALDKPAGRPCPNLGGDLRCTIHTELRPRGFPGCDVYDCFGAGQRLSQQAAPDQDWRASPDAARRLFTAFGALRTLHELLRYLAEALSFTPAGPHHADLHADLAAALDATERAAAADVAALAALDVGPHRRHVADLLRAASTAARTGGGRRVPGHRGAPLIGADLRGADLRGADLTGALFVTPSQLLAARGDAATRLPAHLPRPTHWPAGPRAAATTRRH